MRQILATRDHLLKATYKGLPKLRYVSVFGSVVCPLVDLPHSSFRAACILSWSHKPAHLPSYSEYALRRFLVLTKSIFLFAALYLSAIDWIQSVLRVHHLFWRRWDSESVSIRPCKISTGFGSQTYFHAVGGSGPLTFISTIRVATAISIDPKPNPNGIECRD